MPKPSGALISAYRSLWRTSPWGSQLWQLDDRVDKLRGSRPEASSRSERSPVLRPLSSNYSSRFTAARAVPASSLRPDPPTPR